MGRRRERTALLAALGALVLVAPFAFASYRRSAEKADAELVAGAEEHMTNAVTSLYNGSVDAPGEAWQVNWVDGWVDQLADDREPYTNPPLFRLAEDASTDGFARSEYAFDGDWLAYARPLDDANSVVVAISADQRNAARDRAALMWALLSLLAAAAAGAVGWFLSDRVQAPVRRAHLVNRDFIADAAHELRTPLSIIQASAGHALARERSVGDYQESLAEILAAAERAGDSVGELLEFARLEAGQASLRLAPLRLDLLVEEVAVSVRADNTTVEVAPSEAVVVEADYNLIRQVVDNITRNAVARADKVWLSANLDGTMARIDIADNGPGFDPGMIDFVFERFRRGDRSGSAGLGMAIARTIVELHSGRCGARNQEGEQPAGALVSVWLPLTQRQS